MCGSLLSVEKRKLIWAAGENDMPVLSLDRSFQHMGGGSGKGDRFIGMEAPDHLFFRKTGIVDFDLDIVIAVEFRCGRSQGVAIEDKLPLAPGKRAIHLGHRPDDRLYFIFFVHESSCASGDTADIRFRADLPDFHYAFCDLNIRSVIGQTHGKGSADRSDPHLA
ncbi:MAG: hypothetical protein QM605_00800, partial [Sphingobium sp.]